MTTRVITKLDSVSFDTLLEQQLPFLATEPVFDLTTVTLITPSPVVQIAASCHALAAVGRVPTVKVGSDLVRSYLARCGFFQVVEGVSRSEPEMSTRQSFVYTARHGSSPMLIEVTQLQDGSALPDLLDKIVWVLRRKLKYRKYDAFDIATVVSELCQNTFDHNVETSGFVAMQVYGKGRKRFLEAAVSDFGAGLLTTLKRNPGNAGLRTDLDAIKAAMQLGISEHNDPTRGAGLYHLLEITYKHQGALQIKSGGSKVRYRMDKRQGWAFSVPAIPGVHIAVDLPSKAAVIAGEA
jgi:anti-sigma regulatory factor (Ser/Thr protein kinase)